MTKQFTKADMKEGYGVLRRNGVWWRWAEHYHDFFNEDLTCVEHKKRDIMLVVDTECNVLFKREEPKAVVINGIEVPAGVSEPLEIWQEYYVARPDIGCKYTRSIWCNDSYDHKRLKRGLIHLTKENAIAMSKAMLAFEKGVSDEAN